MITRPKSFAVYALLISDAGRFRRVVGHADTEPEARAMADAQVREMFDVAYVVTVERSSRPIYVARRPTYASWAVDEARPPPADVIEFKGRRS